MPTCGVKMGFINKLVVMINTECEIPTALGTFHIVFLLLVICACVLLVAFFKESSDRVYRIIVGSAFLLMLVMEIFKQIIAPMSVVDGELVYRYAWSDFPFQLCSTPLYVFPLLVFLSDGRLRDVAAAYTMTFSLIGGIAVYLVPKTVFSVRLALNIQTMVHHGLQIVIGIYTAARYRARINRRFFLDGVGLFAGFYAIANLLNTVGYDFFVARGWMTEGDSFNMFYVSPRADQTIPVLDGFLGSLPPVLYICGYFIVTAIGALILMLLAHYIGKLYDYLAARRLNSCNLKETGC